MSEEEQRVDKDLVRQLVDGTIDPEEARRLLRMPRKDADRFWKYLEVLQEKLDWDEPILLRLTDKLYVVRNTMGERVVKCECGREFGDYRRNWKLQCRIRTRRTEEEFREIYHPAPACPEEGLQEIREFICPCPQAAQLAVEVVPPGYPVVFEMLPDLDRFYRDYLGQPLPDEDPGWYEDHSAEVTAEWKRDSKG